MREGEGEEVTEPALSLAAYLFCGLLVLAILGMALELVGVWP